MQSNILGMACLVAIGMLVSPSPADAQQTTVLPSLSAQAAGDKSKGEGRQIELREQWWNASRGLDKNRNAARQRRAALGLMRNQMLRQARTHRTLGTRAQFAPWRELGPSSMKMGQWVMGRVSGRINAIATHPTNDNIVYIGSANGGVWKTTDAGANWTPTFANVGSQSVSAVHIEPGNPQNVWAGTGDRSTRGACSGYLSDGVFYSTDGGNTWSSRNTGMNLSIVTSLVTQANNANVVLAAGFGDNCNQGGDANGGIYRSTDKGATWTQVLDRRVEDLVALPGTSTILASAPSNGGVYRSTDGGATWTRLGLGDASTRMRLAVAPSDPTVIYVLSGSRLFRSDNAGSTWATVNTAACDGQCTYNLAVAVHPTDPKTVIVGAIRPHRSTDGGTTFAPLTDTWGSTQTVHQDIHVVRYSMNDPNRIWIGSDGGIWRTDNGTASWVNMNANLNITQFYDIVVHPTDKNIVFGGAQDNSSSGRTTSNVWDLTRLNGDGFMNAIDETNPTIVFQNGYPMGRPQIFRSTQSGAPDTFKSVGSSGLPTTGFEWVTATDVAGGFHFVGGSNIFRAIASATTMTWTAISPVVEGKMSVVTAKKIGSNVHVYSGTYAGKVYYTSDAANASMVDVTGNLPAVRVSDVSIDPANGSRAFATLSGFGGAKLYGTTTGGTTWTALGNGLPDIPANTVVIDPLNTQRLFVGTDIGVYESTDGGASFVPFSDGMPAGLVISDLEIDGSPHVLTAGTFGRGAWQTDLGGGVSTYSNSADYPINDLSTIESPITVSGRSGNGQASTPVTVNIVHNFIGDLKVDLVAPDGTAYTLHGNAGGSADNINQTFNVNLSGKALNGTWKLRVNDNARQDTGYINSWSITF
jgi:hypothetical protein